MGKKRSDEDQHAASRREKVGYVSQVTEKAILPWRAPRLSGNASLLPSTSRPIGTCAFYANSYKGTLRAG